MSISTPEAARRLFFALWPDREIRDRIMALPTPVGRPVPPENWHVTLLFLGTVKGSLRRSLEADVDHLHAKAFQLVFDQRGYWRRAGVAWLGVSQTPPELEALHQGLRALAVAREIPVEERAFAPHLTLARKARYEPRTTIEPIVWEVADFALMESVSGAEGVRYRPLRRWRLQAST